MLCKTTLIEKVRNQKLHGAIVKIDCTRSSKNGAMHKIVSKYSDVTKYIVYVLGLNQYGVGSCALLSVNFLGYLDFYSHG